MVDYVRRKKNHLRLRCAVKTMKRQYGLEMRALDLMRLDRKDSGMAANVEFFYVGRADATLHNIIRICDFAHFL